MPQTALHQHAFWLYGVIVGLAIKAALDTTFPKIIEAPPGLPWEPFPEVARAFIFLVLVVRFYLGSALYFDEVYGRPDSDEKYPKKSYGMDFLFGFMHFLGFFALALSIDRTNRPTELFVVLLSAVLLYDVVWFIACRQYDTRHRMKLWAVINVLTFVVALALYAVVRLGGWGHLAAEQIALLAVLFASAVDIAEIVRQRPIFKEWIAKIINP